MHAPIKIQSIAVDSTLVTIGKLVKRIICATKYDTYNIAEPVAAMALKLKCEL